MILQDQPAFAPLAEPDSGSDQELENEDALNQDFQFGSSSSSFSIAADCSDQTNTPQQHDTPNSNRLGATTLCTPVTSRASSGNHQIVMLLQQQQATMRRVLDGQKALEEWQDHIEEKLSDLQAKVDSKSPQCCGMDSGADGKRKRVVTKSLSVSACYS